MKIHPNPEALVNIGTLLPFTDELRWHYVEAAVVAHHLGREAEKYARELWGSRRLADSLEVIIEAEIAKGNFPEDLKAEFEAARDERRARLVSQARQRGRPRKS